MSDNKNANNINELANSLKGLKTSGKKTGSKAIKNAFMDIPLPTSKGSMNGDKYKMNAGLGSEQYQKFSYMISRVFPSKGKTEMAEFMVDLTYELMCELNDRGIDIFEKDNDKPSVNIAIDNISKCFQAIRNE